MALKTERPYHASSQNVLALIFVLENMILY